MTPEQIEYLINQYDQRAEKALKDENKSEWRRYSAQAKRLKKWRDEDGAAEPCPVNYEEDGLTLEGARSMGVHVENLNVILEQPATPQEVEAESRTGDATDEQAAEVERPLKPAQTDRADSLYNEANEAFKKEDWGKAKQLAGELARLGDSRGDEIIMAVDLPSGDGGGKVNAGTLQKIKVALRNRDNIEILGNGVRDAEQLEARGQADEELLTLLKYNRERWDEMRTSQGDLTTKFRLGIVTKCAEAVDELTALIIANNLTIWDVTLDTYRKTSDVLAEARSEWEKTSPKTAGEEIEKAQQDIPHRLDLAKKRLEKAYTLPYYTHKEKEKIESARKPSGFAYHENDRSRLYEQLGKVEVMIAQRDKAESLVEQARNAPSKEQALNFLIYAHSQWQHLAGLEELITVFREDVAKLLVVKMQNKISEAEKALDIEDFDKASKALDNAREIKAAFPGEPLPALVDTLAKVEATEQEVRKRQATAKKFAEQAKEIRGFLKDNNKYQLGIDLFETLKSEFADYPPLAKLGVEVGARRGPAEQWQEIQKLVAAEKWDDVATACSNLIHGGKGGDFAPQAKIILNKAQSELQIGQAKALLGQRHITDAENKFKEVIAKDKGRAPELQGYLDEIQTYKQNDKEAKKKMDGANKLRSSPNLEDQWLALQLYGDVADGDTSSYTVEAREKREALSASLREKLLAKIKNVSQLKTINPDSLKEAATCARVLRQAQMEMDDGEKRLARALELKWLKQDAVKLSALGRWEEAAQKWQELEESYPTDLDIQLESRLARKQRAIKEAESKINEEMNATAALELLKEEQTRGRWGADGDLNWWLGEAYRLLKDFTNAERCAENAHRDPATKSKGEGLLQSIRDDRTITTVEEQVATQRRGKEYESALEHINRLDPNLQKRHDVLKWRDDVLAEARKELLEIAKSEFRNNTTDSIAVAFEALARLNRIEKMAGTKESQADAASREKLPQWPNIARSVATRAAVFKPAHLPLVNASDQAKRLLNQLEAFDLYGQKLIDDGVNAIDRFDKIGQRSAAEKDQRQRVEDWVENIRDIRGNLQEEIKRVRNYDQRLGEIKLWMSKIVETSAQMDQYSDRVAWQIAVRENDFKPMSNIVQNILTIAGNDAKVPEVQNLQERLEETKELCAILRQQFNHIMYGNSNLFIATENFAECVRVCKDLQNLPPREDPAAKGRLQQLTYASTGKTAPLRSWQAIKDIADYQRILRWLDPELDFNDSFLGMKISQMKAIKEDGELNLEKIGRLAEQRKADLEKWEIWMKDGERLHKAAKEARDNAETGGHQGAVRLRRAWAAAIPPLAKAESYFSRDPAEISSDRAQVLKEKERKLFGEVTTWKKEAEAKIADYSECSESSPTINDIKNRAKSNNYYELAKCLIQAKSSDGDKAYQAFALGVEDNVLVKIKRTPPSNQLQELHEQAEKCLGADDSLTKKLAQVMNKAR